MASGRARYGDESGHGLLSGSATDTSCPARDSADVASTTGWCHRLWTCGVCGGWATIRSMLTLGLPISLSCAVRAFVYNTDSFFLARIGAAELVGATLAMVWIAVLTTPMFSSALILNTVCSEAKGGSNPASAGQWLQVALVVSTCAAIAAIALMTTTTHVVAGLFTDTSADLAAEFSWYYSIAILPQAWYTCVRQFFQSFGVVLPAVAVSVVTVATNGVANYVYIYKLDLGLSGSALAGVTTAWLQLVVYLAYVVGVRRYHARHWSGWSRASFTRDRVRTYLKLSLSTAAAQALDSWSIVFLTLIAAWIGPAAVAANALALNLWKFLWALVVGLGVAIQIQVASSLGGSGGSSTATSAGAANDNDSCSGGNSTNQERAAHGVPHHENKDCSPDRNGSGVNGASLQRSSTKNINDAVNAAKAGIVGVFAVSTTLAVVVFLLRHQIAHVLVGSAAARETVGIRTELATVLPFMCAAFVCYELTVGIGYIMEGTARPKILGVAVFMGQWVVMLPAAVVLVRCFGDTLRALWVAVGAGSIVKLIVLFGGLYVHPHRDSLCLRACGVRLKPALI